MPRVSFTQTQLKEPAAAELLRLCLSATATGAVTDESLAAIRTWLITYPDSALPSATFLKEALASFDAAPDRRMIHRSIELVLPMEDRSKAKERRRAVEAEQKAAARSAAAAERSQAAADRLRNRRLITTNFMVAGIHVENRGSVIAAFAREGSAVYLRREPDNPHDSNAIRIFLENGADIGFVPREDAARLAPFFDSGCRQDAEITKILDRGRIPIPVVDVRLYPLDADVGMIVNFEQDQVSLARTGNSQDSGFFAPEKNNDLWMLIAVLILIIGGVVVFGIAKN